LLRVLVTSFVNNVDLKSAEIKKTLSTRNNRPARQFQLSLDESTLDPVQIINGNVARRKCLAFIDASFAKGRRVKFKFPQFHEKTKC